MSDAWAMFLVLPGSLLTAIYLGWIFSALDTSIQELQEHKQTTKVMNFASAPAECLVA